MIKGIRQLYQANLLSLRGIYTLAQTVYSSGINLSALLHFAAKLNPTSIAVNDQQQTLTYAELHQQSLALAYQLRQKYHFKAKQRVAIISRNNSSLLKAIFACARLGLDIYLLTAELSKNQYQTIFEAQQFDFVIYEHPLQATLSEIVSQQQLIPLDYTEQDNRSALAGTNKHSRLPTHHFSHISVLTAGSTGTPKIAARQSSITAFLSPFYTLLTRLNLTKLRTIYIATPVYHGFGLATVCIAILLGKTLYFREKFDAAAACELIEQHNIDTITLVPLMLSRMLHHNVEQLRSLQCIITGGAAISSDLVKNTLNQLGPKLFNLYGTSEAGLCLLATPVDLIHAPNTIGKAIAGIHININDEQNNQLGSGTIGRLTIKCRWATSGTAKWIDTGDLVYRDQQGYYYLMGRSDDLIITGGENVYPIELENSLLAHPDIKEAVVIKIDDVEFGQRCCAFVVTKNVISMPDITLWLKQHLARYQQPKHIIELAEIPTTAIGKPDKKVLQQIYQQTLAQ